MFDYMKFCEACLHLGINEADVARRIGITRASITGWKKGSQPSPANLKKLSNLFDAPVSYFEKQEEPEKQEIDDELQSQIDELKDNPELRMLLSATRGLSEEDIRALTDLAKRFRQ